MDVDPGCCQVYSTAQVQPPPAATLQHRACVFSDPVRNEHTDYVLASPGLNSSKLVRALAKLPREYIRCCKGPIFGFNEQGPTVGSSDLDIGSVSSRVDQGSRQPYRF